MMSPQRKTDSTNSISKHQFNLYKYFMKTFINFKNERDTLLEGGAFGHLSHPYDVEDFTFKDLKDIIRHAFHGELKYVEEKTDGQNILASWKNGQIIFARNKGHLKNKGENALTLADLISKFKGRGSLSDAFSKAGIDLEIAIKALSEKQRTQIFASGKKFVSLEIIYAKNPNVILYDNDELRFHGTLEYNDDGELISQINKDEARLLAKMIDAKRASKQKTFSIQALKVPKLPKLPNYKEQTLRFVTQLAKIQKSYNLKDNNKLSEYKEKFWMKYIKDNKFKSPALEEILLNRWARGIKQPSISKIKKEYPDEANKITFFEKNYKKLSSEMMAPFDILFLKMGATLLKGMTDLMVVSTDKSTLHLKKQLDKLEKDITKTKDPKVLSKFKSEMQRLNDIGGAAAIIPSEGITFIHKGQLLKLTGTFAPINQLVGMLRFQR